MTEKQVYQTFRKNVIKPQDRCDRIENPMAPGMPDVNCCINGVEFWVEIKATKMPARKTTPVLGTGHKVSQEQKNWHFRQEVAEGL